MTQYIKNKFGYYFQTDLDFDATKLEGAFIFENKKQASQDQVNEMGLRSIDEASFSEILIVNGKLTGTTFSDCQFTINSTIENYINTEEF